MNSDSSAPKLASPVGAQDQKPTAVHARQIVWQVWVPLAAGILIFLALAVWAVILTAQPSGITSVWADISLIFMIIPTSVAGLLILTIFGLIIFGLGKLSGVLPVFFLRLQGLVYRIAAGVYGFSNALVKPVFGVNSGAAAWRNFWAHFKKN